MKQPDPLLANAQRLLDRLNKSGWCQNTGLDNTGACCIIGAIYMLGLPSEQHSALEQLVRSNLQYKWPDLNNVNAIIKFNDGHKTRFKHVQELIVRSMDSIATCSSRTPK